MTARSVPITERPKPSRTSSAETSAAARSISQLAIAAQSVGTPEVLVRGRASQKVTGSAREWLIHRPRAVGE